MDGGSVWPRALQRPLAGAAVALLAGAAGVAVESTALAQEDYGPRAVFDRPRDAYDPKGIDLGGFRLYPSARLSETYDDNIFAVDDDEESDFITTMAAGLLLESEWTRHELQLDARLSHQMFLDNGDQDRTEYLVRPELRLDLAERDQATFTAEHSRRTVGRDDPEDAGDEEPTEFNRFASSAEYIRRINRFFIGAGGEVRRDDYISSDDNHRDRTEYRFDVPLGYEVSPLTDVVLEPFARIRDYDERDPSGANRDSQSAGATIGLSTEVTPLFLLDFDIGFVANDYDDSQFDNSVDLIFGTEATWYVTELTTLIGEASRRDVSTGTPGASSKTQSVVGIALQHELRRNILLGAGVRYLNDDFRELDRNDHRAIGEVELEYLLNRYLSVVADYRYEQRWSDVEGGDFDRNLVTVGLRGRL